MVPNSTLRNLRLIYFAGEILKHLGELSTSSTWASFGENSTRPSEWSSRAMQSFGEKSIRPFEWSSRTRTIYGALIDLIIDNIGNLGNIICADYAGNIEFRDIGDTLVGESETRKFDVGETEKKKFGRRCELKEGDAILVNNDCRIKGRSGGRSPQNVIRQ